MIETIRVVFERYGFEPLETPAIEYTDALGKFLPDQDRPNEGVFSFQDDDEQWLSLRYDLTAPLARYVAENFQTSALPFRSYRAGYVFRNEKPGPGRFRQFMQFDADTVGSASMAADAEMCMLAADTMEALGIQRGHYVVKVNNRKVLDGVLDALGIAPDKRLTDDARDRQARPAWRRGRRAAAWQRPQGRERRLHQRRRTWRRRQIETIVGAISGRRRQRGERTRRRRNWPKSKSWSSAAGYSDRVKIDKTVVRGLEYYTGPVYEVELLLETKDEKGRPVRFGSVGGGGRYDGLVSRFRGEPVPATGFSIGVSRLQAALTPDRQARRREADRAGRRHRVRQGPHRRLPGDGRASCATPASAPSSISAIRSTASASSSNMPTSAARPARSSRGPTKRRQARSRSRIWPPAPPWRPAKAPGRSYLQKQTEAQVTVPEGQLVEAVKKIVNH